MHTEVRNVLGILYLKKHHFSYQYCIFPFFSLDLGDKQKRPLLCFRIGYSSSRTSREHTGDINDGQMHFGRAVVHLHDPDNNSMESTQEGWGGDPRDSEAFASLQWHTLPHHTLSLSEKSKKRNKKKQGARANHLTHFHPISTAECVHFRP